MRKHKHINSLRTKCYLATFCAVAMLCAVAVLTTYFMHSYTLENRYTKLKLTVAQSVNGILDADKSEEYISGLNSEQHIKDNIRLQNLADDIQDIYVISVYKFTKNGMYTVFDTTSERTRGGVGDFFKYTKEWESAKTEFLSGKPVENLVVPFSKGMTSVYAMPAERTDDGYVYICVGVLESLTKDLKSNFLFKNSMGILIAALVFLILIFVYMEFKILRPINIILAFSKMTVEQSDSKLINEIMESHTKTGREIENIKRSLIKIYTAKVRLSSVIGKENNSRTSAVLSIIKRMDNFYALHLDNSLQYVILLVSAMRKTEKYKKIITKKVYDDILLASPFHDIGKLVIPNHILNKPSSLNDEEYEVMKQHTTLGVKIVQELYGDSEPESYMAMAEEIVKYHHEKWDGTGYPEGLKGEQIPLVARIVTVVDVFDALVSKRVYKEAYPFEKAFSIIEEGRGKHFDPDIVDIFVSLKDKIYNLYLKMDKN